MKWEDNKALSPLEVGRDDASIHTTYERLCYHLVNSHGYPAWVVEARSQVELETMHDKKHAYECVHTHDKPVRITGYEQRPHHDAVEVIHRGMGSDLMALCGLVKGISGHDQVRLSYADEQVTCVKCLQARIKELTPKEAS